MTAVEERCCVESLRPDQISNPLPSVSPPGFKNGLHRLHGSNCIKGLSALVPDKQYSERIVTRQDWFCSSDTKCYDARDFIDTEEYAREIWMGFSNVTIAFSPTLWAIMASKFDPGLSVEELKAKSQPQLIFPTTGGRAV